MNVINFPECQPLITKKQIKKKDFDTVKTFRAIKEKFQRIFQT